MNWHMATYTDRADIITNNFDYDAKEGELFFLFLFVAHLAKVIHAEVH